MRDVFRRRYCWHVRERLDAEAMHRAAAALAGTHDFASFQTSGAERATRSRNSCVSRPFQVAPSESTTKA